MEFTFEEVQLIKMYSDDTPDKDYTISTISGCIPHIEEEDIRETLTQIVKKSSGLTNEAFAKLVF